MGGGVECLLKLQSVEARHLHVEHETCWTYIVRLGIKIILGRSKSLHVIAGGSHEAAQSLAHGSIVVDQEDYGHRVRCRVSGVRFRSDRPGRLSCFGGFGICVRMFANKPTSLTLRELSLKGLLKPVQHPNTFLIPCAKGLVDVVRDVVFLSGHEQVVYGFRSLSATPIHPLNLVTHM